MEKKDKIVKILTKNKILTSEQLQIVEEETKRTGLSFSKALEKLGIITERELTQLISQEIGVPFVDISHYLIDVDLIKLIPQKIAKRYKLMPLFRVEDTLTIAMANPRDVLALDEVRQVTGIENVEAVLSTEEMILKALDEYYIEGEKVQDLLKGMQADESVKARDVELKQAPIIKIVNLIVTEAVRSRASDIHLEPEKDILRLRYRVDGVLHEVNTFPKHLQSAVISRIKLMADMDIAESRLPQDGKISIKIEEKDLDIRVSSFPTVCGENIVMRILDKSSVIMGLDQLGFLKEELTKFGQLIRAPYGIILVTGPTGCGKTTTLYAILSAINSIEKNIVTIEDPVEYELPLIRQTQVNPKAGLTFASELRAILRQDPDIIMVGEIRDTETAEVAIQAALTGHLVLSTLHTNDATSALTRLIDMQIEPFLVSSTVIGVLAQRLIRLICTDCKEKYSPSKDVSQSLNLAAAKQLYRGAGCKICKHTGFLGRTGIFELLMINEELKSMVLRRASSQELRKVAIESGMKSLYQDGVAKVKKGLSTVEEVLRVAKEF